MIIDRINEAQVNEQIDVSDSVYFKTVKFTYDKELGYSWAGDSKINPRAIFPMASIHNVKFFKTLAGAKRNFIKRLG